MVSSNVLSFCRRSSFCLVRVLMSEQVICFSWRTASSHTQCGGRREGTAETGHGGDFRGAGARKRPGKKSRAMYRARVVRAGSPEVVDLEGWAGSEPADSDKWRKGLGSSLWVSAVRVGFLEEAQEGRQYLGADTVLVGIGWLSDPRRPMMRFPLRGPGHQRSSSRVRPRVWGRGLRS